MAEGKAKVHRLHVTTVSLFTRELFKQYNNEGKQKTHDVSHAWSLDWSHLISLQFSLNKTQFASFALFACVCACVRMWYYLTRTRSTSTSKYFR